MEMPGVILLVVSASISFAIGRTVVYFHKKKKAETLLKMQQKTAQALRDAPPGPEPTNKSKRKRLARQSR